MGGVGLEGTLWNLPPRARERVVAFPALHTRSTACGLEARLCGSGRRDGVCPTTGFNLKHMYWLKLILPA